MAVQNKQIAQIFDRIATLLELNGASTFRIRAYQNAARLVESFPKPVSDMLAEGKDLTDYQGIGKDLAKKIEIAAKIGKVKLLTELEKKIPGELADMTKIPGLGAKKVKKLYEVLHIKTLKDLETAARQGKIMKVEGFGQKTQDHILSKLKTYKLESKEARFLWFDAFPIAKELTDYLKAFKDVIHVEVAGSFRRKKPTVGDLDILVTCKHKKKAAIDYFLNYPDINEIVSHGETRASVVLKSHLQVDLRVVADESYGAALQYFTGSKAHGIALRKLAQRKGYKINEYGLYKDGKKIAGKNEAEIYNTLKLKYIPPELRHNTGEIEAAAKNKLPTLVEVGDLKGDLHAHTNATDGKNTLEEMAEAARKLGYQYLAITDHSQHLVVAGGLNADDVRQQIDVIDELNKKWKQFRILKSSEVDILEDGALDLDNDILKKLDVVVCSVHTHRNQTKAKMTKRIIKAMDNPYFSILAHPMGRLIGKREPLELDLEKIIEAAKERGCFVEVNAQPIRLDLEGRYARLAKEMGVKVAISSDAHSRASLENIYLGVDQARRGWLEAKDVINTRSWSELKKLLKR